MSLWAKGTGQSDGEIFIMDSMMLDSLDEKKNPHVREAKIIRE